MKNIIYILAIIITATFQACVPLPGDVEKSELEFAGDDDTSEREPSSIPVTPTTTPPVVDTVNCDETRSITAYAETVHQVMTASSCVRCHSENWTITSQIKHSHSDPRTSWDAAYNSGKIDVNNPQSSRIYQKPANENHYCSGAECEIYKTQVLSALTDWSTRQRAIQADCQSDSEYTTSTSTFTQARNSTRVAQTENGTLVLQAEDGDINGRMRVNVDSKASNHKYINGFTLPNHPYDDTQRTGTSNVRCDIPTSITSSTNGPYRATETRRLVGQDGHLPYYVNLNVSIVRPDKRNEFLSMIRNNDMSNVSSVLLSDGSINLNGSNIVSLSGAYITTSGYPVLPDMRSWSERSLILNSSIAAPFSNLNEKKRYFGFRNNSYYSQESDYLELLNKIEPGFRQKILHRVLWNTVRNFYYRDLSTTNLRPRGTNRKIPYIRTSNLPQYDTFEEFMDLSYNDAERIIDAGRGIRRIDTYLYYSINATTRVPNNDLTIRFYDQNRNEIRNERQFHDMTLGSTNVDLTNMFIGQGAENQTIVDNESKAAFRDTLYPLFRGNSCINCHGDGSTDRPQFAQGNLDLAWNILKDNDYISFVNPATSRPIERVRTEFHNCGTSQQCLTLGNEMLTAITQWSNRVNAFQASLPTNSSALAYSVNDRTPAHATYNVHVQEDGLYNLWLKYKGEQENSDQFYVRIKRENGQPVSPVGSSNSCVEYNFNTSDSWTWILPQRDNESARVRWNLARGNYTIELFEGRDGGAIDLIALNKNPEFAPHEQLIDEGNISDIRPNILRYDISDRIGLPAWFEVELIDLNTESWQFRNPRFISSQTNIKVKNIKININNSFEFNNATWTLLDRVQEHNTLLTQSPLVALKVSGYNDNFSITFEELSATTATATIDGDDKPVPVNGRQCLEIELFASTVEPILNSINLIRKEDDGYSDYVNGFPGSRRMGQGTPQLYNCTTCHNEDHPYFKMTTFLDPSETDLQARYGDLCSQAISRVDFTNPTSSLFIRGLNGTHNHPKLHFIENANLVDSDSNFERDSEGNLVVSIMSEKAIRYTSQDLNLNNYSGSDRQYLEGFLGQPRQIRYLRYSGDTWENNPNLINPEDNGATLFEEIMTVDDDIAQSAPFSERPGRGSNRYEVINPQDFVDNQAGLSSSYHNERDRNNRSLKNIEVNRSNSNEEMFESIKSKYRQAVIRWIEAERAALNRLQQ